MDHIEGEPIDSDAEPVKVIGMISIVADLAPTFTFASHQNSIPVFRSVSSENLSAQSIENARLELTASPAFLRAKTWAIDRILVGESINTFGAPH